MTLSGSLFNLLGALALLAVGVVGIVLAFKWPNPKNHDGPAALLLLGVGIVLASLIFCVINWDAYAHTLGGWPK